MGEARSSFSVHFFLSFFSAIRLLYMMSVAILAGQRFHLPNSAFQLPQTAFQLLTTQSPRLQTLSQLSTPIRDLLWDWPDSDE